MGVPLNHPNLKPLVTWEGIILRNPNIKPCVFVYMFSFGQTPTTSIVVDTWG